MRMRRRTLASRLRARRRRRWVTRMLALGGAVALGRRLGPKEKKLWQRMFDKLPDGFPPKAMFLNIRAIRAQNERIIQLLEEHQHAPIERPLKTG